MTGTLEILDWVLVGGTAAMAVLGAFLGFSGQVSTVAGFGAASAAGYFLYGLAVRCAVAMGFAAEGAAIPGAVLDLVFALVAFGLARLAVKRFVKDCLGAFNNALLGGVVGLLAGVVAVGFLAGVGTASAGRHGETPFAEHSVIVRTVASWADGLSSRPPAGTGRRGDDL